MNHYDGHDLYHGSHNPERCRACQAERVSTHFIKHEGRKNVYEFECACGVTGEVRVGDRSQSLIVHCELMGFVQRFPKSIFEKPRLETVTIQREAGRA